MGEVKSQNRIWRVPGHNFSAELSLKDGDAVLALDGEIDVYTFPTLSHAVDDLISEGFRHITMDFYNVLFLDSGGISVLIRAHKILQANQGELKIERMHGHAYRVLEITGLTDYLNVRKFDREMAA